MYETNIVFWAVKSITVLTSYTVTALSNNILPEPLPCILGR